MTRYSKQGVLGIVSVLTMVFCFSLPAYSANPAITHPAVKQDITKTVTPSLNKIDFKVDAEVENIGFRTEANGDWVYTYSVKNTGLKPFAPRSIQYQASQRLMGDYAVPIHSVTTAHTVNVGSEISGAYNFDRCSTIDFLQLRVVHNDKVLAVKQETPPEIKAKIINVQPSKDKKSLKITLKNDTGHSVKLAIKAVSSKKKLVSKIDKKDVVISKEVLVKQNATETFSMSINDLAAIRKIVLLFEDEKKCPRGPGYVVLDTKNASFGSGGYAGTGPAAYVQDINWNSSSKTWLATIKNNDPYNAIKVRLAGYPLENGTQGMTVWAIETIPANDTVTLRGDYSSYAVPAGTRLKVHVLRYSDQVKLHEKIIVLN